MVGGNEPACNTLEIVPVRARTPTHFHTQRHNEWSCTQRRELHDGTPKHEARALACMAGMHALLCGAGRMQENQDCSRSVGCVDGGRVAMWQLMLN